MLVTGAAETMDLELVENAPSPLHASRTVWHGKKQIQDTRLEGSSGNEVSDCTHIRSIFSTMVR